MTRISDALELLTAQHQELDVLLRSVATAEGEDRALAFGLFADKLITHLDAEHDLFFPSIALAASSIAEHEALKNLTAELLQRDLGTPDAAPLLGELATVLAEHARSQEDDLFVLLAQTLSIDTLAGLGDELRDWSESSLCIAA